MSDVFVIGIDPGLATGGMVLIKVGASDQKDEVIDVFSLVDKKSLIEADRQKSRDIINASSRPWGDRKFTETSLRVDRWVEMATAKIKEWEVKYKAIQAIAIESFVDQPSRAKQIMQLRWQTPFLMGVLAARLKDMGYTPENGRVFYQNAGTVLKQWQFEIERLKKSKRKNRASKDEWIIVKGDFKVTNDHLRKALAHGLALCIRIRENQKSKTES